MTRSRGRGADVDRISYSHRLLVWNTNNITSTLIQARIPGHAFDPRRNFAYRFDGIATSNFNPSFTAVANNKKTLKFGEVSHTHSRHPLARQVISHLINRRSTNHSWRVSSPYAAHPFSGREFRLLKTPAHPFPTRIGGKASSGEV